MKNGVLEETDGFDIVVNGRNLTFRDVEENVIAAARFHKQRLPKDEVQIRTCADGTLRTVREDYSLA
jgi:hypothetical protein